MSKALPLVAVLALLCCLGFLGSSAPAPAGTTISLVPAGIYPLKAVEFPCTAGNSNTVDGNIYSSSQRASIAAELAARNADGINLGAAWIRMPLLWDHIETGRGVFGGTTYSRNYIARVANCMSLITGQGMKVLLDVLWTPSWAEDQTSTNERHWWDPPDDCLSAHSTCSDFSGFMDWATRQYLRYGASDIAFEIWNEPNILTYWNTLDGTLRHQRYSYLLKAGYAAVKAVPGASAVKVLMGGVTSLGGGNGGTTWTQWVTYMYQDACGANPPSCPKPRAWPYEWPYWDVVALHPYPHYARANPCPSIRSTFSSVSGSILNTMRRYGDGSKDIWFTEFGWSSGSQNSVGNTQKANGSYLRGYGTDGAQLCTESQQSGLLTGSYTYNYVPYPNTRVLSWFTSDRGYLDKTCNGSVGCGCPNLPDTWDCGTELLGTKYDNLNERSVYTAFKNAPQ